MIIEIRENISGKLKFSIRSRPFFRQSTVLRFNKMVFIEQVIPSRYAMDENLIICQRVKIEKQLIRLRKYLADDVQDTEDVKFLKKNEVYAMKRWYQSWWSRATVKFFRKPDNVPVLQKVDEAGTIDFDSTIQVREIKNNHLKAFELGNFKLFIYGVLKFTHDEEYELIFRRFKTGVVTAIYDQLEAKDDLVHECFVGDLIQEEEGRVLSIREVLIHERLTYPRHINTEINLRILQARTQFMANRNDEFWIAPQRVDEFDILQVIGEGTVSILTSFYFSANYVKRKSILIMISVL